MYSDQLLGACHTLIYLITIDSFSGTTKAVGGTTIQVVKKNLGGWVVGSMVVKQVLARFFLLIIWVLPGFILVQLVHRPTL